MQGLLLLDKSKNKSSYGAVACIKRISGEKRIGHTGTLDPMATGVLPILLGRATALSSYLLDADKCYTAKIKLGIETDSCDITGNIIDEKEVDITTSQLNSALENFCGKIKQTPPMFSALKKDGVRLYELARRGETVDIPEREVEIFSIKLLSALDSSHEFEIEVHVSKGTYIRSLARDIGRFLGCNATLTELRRTAASGFKISECVALDDLNEENLHRYILSEETVVMHLRAVDVTEKQAVRFCNGGELDISRLKIKNILPNEIIRVCCNNLFLGLGIYNETKGQLSVKCVIRNFKTEGSL